ncbi:glutamate racemase [Moraxella haemolytica]|uniref:glutamate racemase n=1 Tax=Moraxella haemolytica TaxID=2904119 RepID=UPI0025433CC7|nr:glutamate racemase [Moraxella sp. ZY171148]WII94895.1 glutamate racemase [Moraxella sp. ZY171148]
MINQHPDYISDSDNAPIGVFDSGVGGLSVYRHLRQLLPNERFIYYADTAHVPYGNKTGDEILLLTLQAVARLCKQGCKLIVIACNSASAHALTTLRQRCSVPIVGLVPAVKPACAITKTKKIAVLATRATLDGHLLNEVIGTIANPLGIQVHKHFESMLVPWVESGMPIDSQVANLLIEQVKLWADDGVDVIVLGCTHYPFFKQFLQTHIDDNHLNITLVDSGVAIAERVRSLLDMYQITAMTPKDNPLTFYASAFDEQLVQTVAGLIDDTPVFVGHDFLPQSTKPSMLCNRM